MTIWLTADIHYGHKNIIKYSERPFKNITEMNNTIVSNWNSVATCKDTVYILGDITLESIHTFREFIKRIVAKEVFIIPGGHDKRWVKQFPDDYFHKYSGDYDYDKYVNIVSSLYEIRVAHETIVLCHYPMETWEKSHYGSLHFHGHAHCHLPLRKNRLDVGVDCHNFFPVSLEQAKKLIQENNANFLDKND